ncbi:MAG: hypothetical protein OEY63_06650, partial [Gemmatimonadota bacterium]|nr:hypothetical protein [Gemmatimonadota bacterium]
MSSNKIYGHETIRARLADAIEADRLPQAILFTGSAGVGKQRLALWLARAVLCRGEGVRGEDGCQSCLQANNLKHPDLHWFVPLDIKKRASDPEKQIEEVEAALAEVMEERRTTPLYPVPETLGSHSIASARLIQRRVGVTPFMSRKKVVIVGDADRLIVQEASQEAANALLKVLEEPPEDTVLLFTSSSPQRLLDTIRSRLVPVRVGPLPNGTVEQALV